MTGWEAAVRTADISPEIGAPIFTFPRNAHSRPEERVPRLATAIHDPILVTALVLRYGATAVAICSIDVCGIPGEVVARVRQRVDELAGGGQSVSVLNAASHTHHGPVVEEGDPWTEMMIEATAQAVKDAFDALQPARIGIASGSAQLNFNRRIVVDGGMTLAFSEPHTGGQGPTDPEIGVIRIDDDDGEPIAVCVNYTAHPLVMGPPNMEFTADYPGALRRYLERAIGRDVAVLFLNGAAGNIHPKLAMQMEWGEVERLGARLGRAVMPAYQSIQPTHDPGPASGEQPPLACTQEVLEFPNRMDSSLTTPIEIDVVRIGDSALCFVPGEFFVEFQLWLKRSSRAKHTFMVGFANDSVGYVPTLDSYALGGYGVEKHQGDPASWSRTRVPPGAGEEVTARILQIVNGIDW